MRHTHCAYTGNDGDCERETIPGWTTCRRHYSAGQDRKRAGIRKQSGVRASDDYYRQGN